MAFGDGSIGTQTGIGQGLAYILPETKSEDYALKLAQDESAQIARNAAAQLKRQQALQDSIQKQVTAQKLPKIWSPFNEMVVRNNQDWMKKAATEQAQGKNPFTNADLMAERDIKVNGIAAKSNELGTQYAKLYSAAVADAGKKYMDEDIQKVLDAEKDIVSNPQAYLDGKKTLPELRLKPADFEAFTKLIKPTGITDDNGTVSTTKANRSAHIDQSLNTLMANPDKWAPMALNEFGLDLTKPTYPVLGSNGRKVYPTNQQALEKVADKIFARPTAEAELAQFGIDVADEFAKEKFVDAMKKQNQGIGRFLTQSADLADAKVAPKRNVDNWREKSLFNKSIRLGESADPAVLYRQKQVQGIVSGDRGPIEALEASLAAQGGYENNGLINVDENDKQLTITIPARKEKKVTDDGKEVKTNTVSTPARTITINKNRPEELVKVNRLISEITGENISESKVMTGEASGKIKNGTLKPKPASASTPNSKTVPVSKIKSLIGKKGYEGYTEKELTEYYRSQGYTIK